MSETEGYVPPGAESFRQEATTAREVKLDETVKPFENFEEKFQIEQKSRGGYEAYIESDGFNTEGIGDWRVHGAYLSADHNWSGLNLDDEDGKVLLALPDGEVTILPSQLHKAVKTMETPLLDTAVTIGEPDINTTKNPSHKFRIRLPSGNEIISISEAGVTNNFLDQKGNSYQALLIPATAKLFEKIEVTPERTSNS